MKEIALTQGKVALVDDEDFVWLNKFKWHVSRKRNLYYAQRKIGGKHIKMHQFILPPVSGYETDHKDGNGLNNQKKNLRYATNSQNQANVKKRQNQPNGFKGITEDKRARVKRWVAFINKNGEKHYLGYHETPVEAAQAYDRAAVELFGEFAKTNF